MSFFATIKSWFRKPEPRDLSQLPPDVALAGFAMQLLHAERQSRGLDSIECPRIVVCIGDRFDSVTITFHQQSLQQGEEQMFRTMAQIGAFQLTPKIRQAILDAQQRARLERMRAN